MTTSHSPFVSASGPHSSAAGERARVWGPIHPEASASRGQPAAANQCGETKLSSIPLKQSPPLPNPLPRGGGEGTNPNRRQTLAAMLTGLLSGCGYIVGSGFGPEIRSVSVPIFENNTYRRNIEYQLTEAVQNEIKLRTPYILAKSGDADTKLTGTIVQIRKDVLGETVNDDPRELQFSIMVRVRWEDLRSGQILASQEVPLSPDEIPVIGQAEFAPEVGHSLATATQDATTRLARRIVNMMETPW